MGVGKHRSGSPEGSRLGMGKDHPFRITIASIEDTIVTRKHKSAGKRTKLGICSFVAALLRTNELIKRKKRLNDETLKYQICYEFHDRPSARALVEGRRTVGWWRLLYNKGFLTNGEVPEVKSKRYGKKGELVHPKTGKSIATQEQRWKVEKKYGYDFVTGEELEFEEDIQHTEVSDIAKEDE